MISDTILLEQHSDDVLFSFTHWFSFSSSHKKSASCVIFIISQLTAFLQTFFRWVSALLLYTTLEIYTTYGRKPIFSLNIAFKIFLS